MAPHDMPRDPKRTAAAVAVAVAVLAVVGAVFGYLLGTQAEERTNPDGALGTSPSPVRSTTPQPPARSGRSCPPVSEKAAIEAGSRGDLRQRLYIRTERSEIWICEDAGGRLWYQGHRLRGKLDAANGEDSLFLGNVNFTGGNGQFDEYVAVNATDKGTTEYTVSRDWLTIVNKNNNTSQREQVLERYPPE